MRRAAPPNRMSPDELVATCRGFLSKIDDVDLAKLDGDTVFVSFDVEIHLHDPPGRPLRDTFGFAELPDGTRVRSGGYDEIHVRAVAAQDVVTGAQLSTAYTYFAPRSTTQLTTGSLDKALAWLARDLDDRTSLSVFLHKTVRTCEDVPEFSKCRTQFPWSNTLKGHAF